MQSIFRLPGLAWSQPTAAALDKPVSFAPIANGSANGNKIKRKRAAESPRSSPQPVVKKMKAALQQQQLTTLHVDGGAVQLVGQSIAMPEQLLRTQTAGTETKPAMAKPVTQADSRFATAGALRDNKAAAGVQPTVSASTSTYTAAMAKHHSLAAKPAMLPLAPLTTARAPAPQHINTNLAFKPTPGFAVGSSHVMSLPKMPIASAPGPTVARAQVAPPTPITPSSSAMHFNGNVASVTSSSRPVSAVSAKPKQSTAAKAASLTMDKDVLRAIVDAEICQTILFKHNELRLIDQELAKCQIALEQIRRCEQIPFPGAQGLSSTVSAHSGPALATRKGLVPPASPAPWGVTDGPYARHYASWLIPSAQFDPMAPQAQVSGTCTPHPKDGRVTRHHSTDLPQLLGSQPPSRASRVANRAKAHADPASPLTGRDPLIIKRQKDGQMVKLYCTQCQPERSDFANVQGFLNHCRISHKTDFKSHEQAAIECGRPVEPGDYFSQPEVATPRESFSKPSVVSTPMVVVPGDRQAVHPLNRSLAVPKERSIFAEQYVPRTSKPVQLKSALPSPLHSPNFVSSPQTPFLSKLVQNAGSVSDFNRMVADSKQKFDLSAYDVDSEPESRAASKGQKSKTKGAPRHGNNKSASKKASSGTASRTNGHSSSFASDPDAMDIDQAPSPHTSADSNPGLVSDREDDFADEDDEPEVLRNPSQSEIVMVRIEDSDGERADAVATSTTGVCSNGITARN
jgi:ADA HAT complex component 1